MDEEQETCFLTFSSRSDLALLLLKQLDGSTAPAIWSSLPLFNSYWEENGWIRAQTLTLLISLQWKFWWHKWKNSHRGPWRQQIPFLLSSYLRCSNTNGLRCSNTNSHSFLLSSYMRCSNTNGLSRLVVNQFAKASTFSPQAFTNIFTSGGSEMSIY